MVVLMVVILLVISILALKTYDLFTLTVPAYGGTYSEGLIGSPRFINPILAQTNDVDTDLSKLIFSGLMKYDKDKQLIPDLAESYQISDDKLTYTFQLKKNIKWHDGEPFKADDVIFTIASTVPFLEVLSALMQKKLMIMQLNLS